MAILEWSPKLSVGIPRFDQQHQALVSLLNKMHDAMIAGQGRTALEGVLQELLKYTEFHFAAEEAAMSRLAFPDAAAHQAEHAKLRAQVGTFLQQYKSGRTMITVNLMNFLQGWLTHHIMQTDRGYSAFFTAHPVD